MRNLILLNNKHYDIGVTDGTCLSYDSLNETIYIATKDSITGYNVSTKQGDHFISTAEDRFPQSISEFNRIISIHYLIDHEALCFATDKGDLFLWQPEGNTLECVGSVEEGFNCAEWSPDQELLVLATGSGTFVLMTRDFDPVCEQSIHSQEFGEATPVTVGWGKKETQFHGSEGKTAAQQKKMKAAVPILPHDSKRTKISWRGDGQYFAISSVDKGSKECRFIRIYDRDGILQTTNELIDGLEDHIAWRPSGNLIASSQRKPNKHDVIFFEKNGLQHGEFTLPYKTDEKIIVDMSWNNNSDVLAILLRNQSGSSSDIFSLQLWTTGNYHWYLKHELNMPASNSSQPHFIWDPEEQLTIHIITPSGIYMRQMFCYDVIQSRGVGNKSMVAVLDGLKLLLTPFKLMIVPPPMATHTVLFPAPVNLVVFGVGKRQHDMIVQLSNKQFFFLKYDNKQYKSLPVDDVEIVVMKHSLRHLVWLRENLLAVISDSDQGNTLLFLNVQIDTDSVHINLRSKLEITEDVHMLFKGVGDKDMLLFEDVKGKIYVLHEESSVWSVTESDNHLPQVCNQVECVFNQQESTVFGLTNHHRLFINSKEMASNCTSFMVHDEFLLLTTHGHTLRSVYLSSLSKLASSELPSLVDEDVRRVERGSKLVTAVQNSTAVVFQMPRGNLECIHPRALIITYLQKLLSGLAYAKVFDVMRRNRINLNLIYDHNPSLFLENVDKFILEMQSVNHLNLFLADLSPEDTCSTLYFSFYHHGDQNVNSNKNRTSSTKVDVVCKAVRNAIERNGESRYMLALLTSYAKQSQPDLETVLVKLSQLKDKPQHEDDSVSFEQALKYILYLVDVNELFDIALGLYNFDIVLMVAQKSQKDPKEYVPFLNNFKNMEENYQRYSIDKHLKRYEKALTHLSKCVDRFNECLEFVREQRLYRQALKLFSSQSKEYKLLSALYGQYLLQQKFYEEAGFVFSRSGHHKEALGSFLKTHNWSMTLSEAKFLNYTDIETMKLCRDMSDKLRNDHLYGEAALLLEFYVKDVEECVVCLLDGGLWFRALQLIQKYDRDDLIETNLKISIRERYQQTTEKLEELRTKYTAYENRLKVVIEKKERERYEILEGLRDDAENDLYSDTSSITGQSVTSASSRASSKMSRTTGHSRKSKSKVGRKKYSLREGSKHEDFALREAMCDVITTADGMKEEISSLLKVMVYYFEDEDARKLQACYDELLQHLENSIKVAWNGDGRNSIPSLCEYGPQSTVETILAQKIAIGDQMQTPDELPPASRPTIRTNLQWKQHVLRPTS